jgi:type II secretory pathway pseudopilin PulG
MDITFWIGAGVGLISALIGAVVTSWLQFKFRIKELSETKKQEQIAQEKEKLAQEEAIRNQLRGLIGNLRTDKEFADYLRKSIDRQDSSISRPFSSILACLDYGGYYGLTEDILKSMSLPELIGFHITLLNITSLFPISGLVNQREDKLERAMQNISALLEQILATSQRPVNSDSEEE